MTQLKFLGSGQQSENLNEIWCGQLIFLPVMSIVKQDAKLWIESSLTLTVDMAL